MGNKRVSPWGVIAIVFSVLIALVAIFCVVVLVYGQCTSLSFVEVLQSWFPFCFS